MPEVEGEHFSYTVAGKAEAARKKAALKKKKSAAKKKKPVASNSGISIIKYLQLFDFFIIW